MLCQVCGAANVEDQEFCRRCQAKLWVVSGYSPEESFDLEDSSEDNFAFDEHLLERISILEEVVKRGADTLRQILGALRKQERSILINHTGLTSLREVLHERGLIPGKDWGEVWQNRLDEHLLEVEKRERFLHRRERILSLHEGAHRVEFEVHLQAAEAAWVAYDGESARRSLEEALRLDGQNFELAYLLGEICFDEGNGARALDHFRRVLELQKNHYEALVYAGAIHYEKGNLAQAEALLRRAAELNTQAFLPQFGLGTVHSARGDLRQAVAFLDRAVELDPMPQALYLLGHCLYEMGRLSEAIRALQQAVHADPASQEAHELLGLAYLDRHWNRKALDSLGRAQHLNPQKMRYRDLVLYLAGQSRKQLPRLDRRARTLLSRAASLLERGDHRRALSACRKALAGDPENPTMLLTYALVGQQPDRGKEIEALTRRVLELDPDEMLRGTAYATLIEALRSQGKYREGNRVGQQLLNEGSSNFTKTLAYTEMAYNLADMGENLDEALSYARQSVELSPDELKQLPLAALGWVHYRRREFEEAIDVLSKTNEIAPSRTTLNHLGLALLASGQQERARSVLARARRLQEGEDGFEEKMIECVRRSRSVGSGARGGPKK
jgi:tetratricopeptide (TPR) repeat protein